MLVGGFLSCLPGFEFITCGGHNPNNKRCNGDFLLQDATTKLNIVNLSMRESEIRSSFIIAAMYSPLFTMK